MYYVDAIIFNNTPLYYLHNNCISLTGDDRCSKDIPCTPSDIDGDPFFCDYQIGPTAGGYCVACEGRQVSIYYDCAYHVNIFV